MNTLTITGRLMRSPYTRHTAWSVPGEPTLWTVTWLPGRNLTHDQAEAAMSIAGTFGQIPPGAGPEAFGEAFWARAEAWSAQLGLAGATAVAWASEPPRYPAPADRNVPACPMCGAGPPHIGWLGTEAPHCPGHWRCTACDHEWDTPRPASRPLNAL